MMRIENLLIQNLSDPLGLETKQPLITYTLASKERGEHQSAYRILVSSSQELVENNIGDLWDSGKVYSRRNFAIPYAGKQLESRQIAIWKVKVWDKADQESDWSELSKWEMGLLKEEDWKALWIGQGDCYLGDKSAAPIIAKDFLIHNFEEMISARLYVSGLGIFETEINGMKIDDTFFDSGESDYSKTVYYVTYDITKALTKEKNHISILLGNGQYVNFIVDPVMMIDETTEATKHRYQKNDSVFVNPGICGDKKVIAQVEVTYADGHIELVAATDSTWKQSVSPITFNNWYGGEDYDATKETECLEKEIESWDQAVVMRKPDGKLKAREFTSIKIVDKFPAHTVTSLPNGNWLVDMGRNVAGFPEVVLTNTQSKDRGSKIRMFPAELLNEDRTGVDQSSCTQSWSKKYHCVIEDSYVMKGTGNESWHPRFAYQGFQYIEVSGFPGVPTVENFNCCVLRTANEKNGSFECSNVILNQINLITEHSIESNMFGAFTDCPQIEKLGWLETSHLMFNSMASSYDLRAWIPKIVEDIVDSQVDEAQSKLKNNEETGYIPAIVPEYFRIGGLYRDPNWSGACIFTPWEYYQAYGDKSILERSYSTMKKYLGYLGRKTKNGLLVDYAQMGDWGQFNEDTPTVLVATCAYYRLLDVFSQIADILREVDDMAYYRKLADRTKIAFHQNQSCYNPVTKEYGNSSQASYGCVLFSHIVLEENRELSVQNLIRSVQLKGYHLTSGEVGLKQVFSVLAENEKNHIVYEMVMNDTQPSYRSFIDDGLTSLPEYWNYNENWYGMVRSRNHAMMGHVKEWLSQSVLGIRSLSVAYEQVKIKPFISEGIRMVKGHITCPYGKIELKCEVVSKTVKMKIFIPVGVTAQVYVPAQGTKTLYVNGEIYPVVLTEDAGYHLIPDLQSGMHRILAR